MSKALMQVAAIYGAISLLAWLVADRMIFLPPPPSYDARGLPVTQLRTEDGASIATLYLPNPAATYTLLFSHGNAEDLGHLAPFLEALRAAGFAVLAYDYRGYGLSSGGFPGERSSYRDQAAVYRYATQELKIPPSRLILHGRSVGSGPAIDLAARAPVAGLIVESAFVSAYRVMTRWPLLPFDKFPNLRKLRRVQCPVFVIHGRQDEIVAPWHGQKLFAVAPEPKHAWWVEGAGHNDLAMVAGQEYLRRLQAFAAGLPELR